MSHRTLPSLVGLLVAVLVGSGLYWLAENVGLALATGIAWGGGFATVVYGERQYSAHYPGSEWSNKWSTLGTVLITIAATVGIGSSFPVSFELRLGLQFLVIGTGFVGSMVATVAELERNAA
ncbi:sterol desaturase [Haloferax mediterranei ATCC 33500]|nr:hypothetical protein [Haloferax mediterranei]AHZ21307.1 sterol desaturase [Haloferax mediterranei ATCC 33500]EMA04471.1 hypothetical protein C439_02312 [Haloferax mediterranei ATCC 33500]MDX5989443.1 sterol desaturase [Haloferax mediterranei ATCC 33500]QCQ75807.1 sterol desaturase [Haloferax mediterranei ATCC 33500]